MVARQFSQRDPVVAYYGELCTVINDLCELASPPYLLPDLTAKMYAVQEGLGIGKSDPEAKAFLISVMDDLDRVGRLTVVRICGQ